MLPKVSALGIFYLQTGIYSCSSRLQICAGLARRTQTLYYYMGYRHQIQVQSIMFEQSYLKNGLNAKAQELPLFSTAAPSLTPSDAKIANYIAEHLSEIMSMTVSDLARAIQVSEITLSRFCKKLELPGLQALKIALSQEQHRSAPFLDSDISLSDSAEEITHKLFANIQEGLRNTLSLLDFSAVDEAARMISASSRILVFGYGNSATVCHDLATRFVRLSKSCEMSSDPHQQMTLASICGPGTVVIGVSYSGASVNLNEVLAEAKRSGAGIILITSHKNSPSSCIADVTLIGLGPEVKHNSESSVSRLIHMAIGDVLYTRVSFMHNHEFERSMTRMRAAVSTLKS